MGRKKLLVPKDPIVKSFNPSVSSHGYSDAEIMFLQGYPLKDDLLSGNCLTGSSENTIRQFLKENGHSINRVYRSIFIREKLEYSATNPKKLRIALSKIDTESYEKLLKEEVLSIAPNVIVPLDDIALAAVFPHISSIHKPKGRKHWVNCYRGSILPLREDWQAILGDDKITRVIPTIGPQLLFADWTARCYVDIDYRRIIENASNRSKIERPGSVHLIKTYEQFISFLRRHLENNPPRLTYDIETFGSLMTCISLTFDGKEACVIDLVDDSIPLGERIVITKALSRLMTREDLEKNNQNIKYDWTIQERHGYLVRNVRSDTMLKGSLLYPELPKGLDFWTSIYTDIPYYKDEGKEYNPKLHTRDRLLVYCGYDALAAHQIAAKQDEELEESGMKQFYETEMAPSILIYKDIDRTGFRISGLEKEKLLLKYDSQKYSNNIVLRSLVNNDTFNPNSPAQVAELIYDNLRYKVRSKIDPETGAISRLTDKNTLDDILINDCDTHPAGKLGYEIISRLIVARKLNKIVEYINTPLYEDGTFRGTSNLAGTGAGRSSSSKTIDEILLQDEQVKNNKRTKKLGRSLQTITKHGFQLDDEIFDDWESSKIAHDVRKMFVPRHNYVFAEVDGSGAEARVVFVLAEDYDGLAAMDQKPKIHAKTASKFFNIPIEQIYKDEKGNWIPSIPKVGISYYDMGKRGRHAGNYDMTAFTLAIMTHLPLHEAQRILNIFHDTEPSIRTVFHAGIISKLRKDRILETPQGRKRMFFGRMEDKTFKEAYSYIPQCTVSDLTKFSMWRFKEAHPFEYYNLYRFITEQHDGITAEVHKDFKNQYFETMKPIYERKINFLNCSLSRDFELSIPVEMSVGADNWYDMEEVCI
jgi:DNA polymerase I